jgi:hypothetical protein
MGSFSYTLKCKLQPLNCLTLIGTEGAVAQTQSLPTTVTVPNTGTDALLTMPLLADKGWFVHSFGGRVRACTADGASVAGERPAPKCSQWSEY